MCYKYWCEAVIHARAGQSGIFKSLFIDPNIEKNNVRVIDLAVSEDDVVHPFTGANMSLGDMFLRFDSWEELDDIMSNGNEWLRVILT